MLFQLGRRSRAVGEGVGDEPHRRARRVHVGPPGHVLLQDVVLDGAAQGVGGHALLLGHELVEQQEDGRGGVDGHRGRDLVQGQVGEQQAHVGEGVNGHPHLAHLALGARVVRVEPHLGGEVEGTRQSRLPCAQEELEPFVGVLGRAEPGVLAHGPQPAPVHAGVDATRVRLAPGLAEPALRIPALEIGGPVHGPYLDARIRASHLVAHASQVREWRGAPPTQAPGGAGACGMHRSSYSAITMGAALSPHAGHSGSRRTLKVRKDSSSAS